MKIQKRTLTNKELIVYNLMMKGFTCPTIGELLGISRTTVATHYLHIREKLEASSKEELMARRIKELEEAIESAHTQLCSRMEDSLLRTTKEILNNGLRGIRNNI